jgi:adenylate cyclase
LTRSNRFLWLASALFILLAALELTWLHGLQPLENRLSDWFVKRQAQGLQPDRDIVLVTIDDPSVTRMLDEVGRWPWPRSVHGELVRGIARQRPKAIVFDLQFTERDVYRPDSDQAFNDALNVSTPVYFPMVRREPELDASAGEPAMKIADQLGLLPTLQAQADAKIAIVPPLAISNQRRWRTGIINFLPDSDGVGRRYYLYPSAYGWLIPSLPARIASDLEYPVPKQQDMILAWRGNEFSFRRISYFELYQDFSREKPLRSGNEFTGKIVIIGTAATGLSDMKVTPIASEYPGVEILATAIDNLKNQRMMQAAPTWVPPLFALTMLLAMATLFLRGVHVITIGGTLLATTVLMLGASYSAVASLYLLPVLSSVLLVWSYYFVCALHLYLNERKAREQAVQMFSRFVNPHVVKEMIARGGLSRVGESRQISVLFSDIRGFTTLSESRTPQEIVELLNRYFALQVAVIFRHGGSLDKFIGDCIMAFWGAPLDDPQHALHAVEAAIEMAEVLQAFKLELGDKDADFDVGIGVHSGTAVVGLIGPQQKLEYTAIGDTVNLASRIESLTKGVSRILVSGDTRDLCGDALDFTPFGSYKVKGREQEVELFAPEKRGLK